MKRWRVTTVLWVAAAVVMMTGGSCSDDSCFDNSSALPLAAFYQGSNAVTVTNLTVKGVGAPGDTLLAEAASLSRLYLPFRLDASRVEFELDYNDEALPSDVITFDYRAIPVFVSHECGAMYDFEITGCNFTSNAIEDVEVVEPLVTNLDQVTVKIYFKE